VLALVAMFAHFQHSGHEAEAVISHNVRHTEGRCTKAMLKFANVISRRFENQVFYNSQRMKLSVIVGNRKLCLTVEVAVARDCNSRSIFTIPGFATYEFLMPDVKVELSTNLGQTQEKCEFTKNCITNLRET